MGLIVEHFIQTAIIAEWLHSTGFESIPSIVDRIPGREASRKHQTIPQEWKESKSRLRKSHFRWSALRRTMNLRSLREMVKSGLRGLRVDWNRGGITLSESINWEDNWDTTNQEDDFCTQLRAEFDKAKGQ